MKKINRNIKAVVLGLALLMAIPAFSQDENFHIYLCFGQSNMEGQGKIEVKDRKVDPRFKVLEAVNCSNLGRKKGIWYTAVPPLTRCWTGLSPSDYFGRTMLANLPANVKIGIINVSIGGCNIGLFDKEYYAAYDSTYTESWFQGILKEYNYNPYAHLIELAKIAQKDGVIKGILLHQGETNTGDNQWPAKVKRIYDYMIADLALDPKQVPLLAGEVVHADQGGVCASMNTIINKLPKTIPNSYVISSSGCKDTTDNLHFSSVGYRELGKRYANKMLSLQGIVPTSIPELINSSSDGFALDANYPNPFSQKTVLSFEIPTDMFVSLKVYSILGAEIEELAGKQFSKGKHSVEFASNNLPNGLYFYTMKADKFSASRKMIIKE